MSTVVSNAAASKPMPADGWQYRRVVTFNGQYDSHIETGEEYATRALSSLFGVPPANAHKASGPAIIPSTYHEHDAREHAAQRDRGRYVALTGDIDHGNHNRHKIEELIQRFTGGAAYLIYSSPHARDGDMRWRIILPLHEVLPFNAWHDAQNAFYDFMERHGVVMDRALARAAQPVFLPNVPAVHLKSGTALRDSGGRPLYFSTISSPASADGLLLDQGEPAAVLADLHQRRADEERLREKVRAEAEARRAARPPQEGASVIDTFNRSAKIADLLASYGYDQSLRHPEDWHSPNQTGPTYATRVIGDKWISLSESDAAAGLGAKCSSGCYGDAYDLFVHYEHHGNAKEAWKAACAEQNRTAPRRQPFQEQADAKPRDEPAPGAEQPEQQNDREPDREEPRRSRSDRERGPLANPEPLDLWARYEAPVLPRGLLPTVIENVAFDHGDEIMGVDPAGVAMAALTVCAAAIHDDIALQVKQFDPSWRESARLWTGMIGPPSTKKTPIMKLATKPLSKLNAQLMERYEREMGEYMAFPAAERKDMPKPKMLRRVAGDATIESLQMALKDSPWGLLSSQDELSGWFGSMDKYSPGKGQQADRAFWLQAFNGGSYIVDRVSRGSSQIPNLSVSLMGGIQPEPIRKITSETVDDGLIQRFIPVILAPARVGKDAPAGPVVRMYEQLVEQLTGLQAPARTLNCDLEEYGRPRPLIFSEDARAVRERVSEEHHGLVQALEVVSPKLSAHFGKYDGLFARLCVVWHCIECAEAQHLTPVVSATTANRVAEFMERFIRPSAIAFYAGMLGLSDGHEQIMAFAAYIVSEGLAEVNARVVQRSTRSLQGFTADEARRLCEKLESFGWLESIDPPARSNTPRWAVNPAVHRKFADKGRQEAERRKVAREALRAALNA